MQSRLSHHPLHCLGVGTVVVYEHHVNLVEQTARIVVAIDDFAFPDEIGNEVGNDHHETGRHALAFLIAVNHTTLRNGLQKAIRAAPRARPSSPALLSLAIAARSAGLPMSAGSSSLRAAGSATSTGRRERVRSTPQLVQ